MAALEAELGVRLIQRSSCRFVRTELGQDFHRHAAAMLIEAEAAEHVLKGRPAEPSGVVRITSSVPTAQLMLADVVVEAARRYPKLRIVVHASDRFMDIVQEGFDVALRDHFNPLPDSGLVQRRIATDPLYLVASPVYLQQKDPPHEPTDLAAHDVLTTAAGPAVWKLENEAVSADVILTHLAGIKLTHLGKDGGFFASSACCASTASRAWIRKSWCVIVHGALWLLDQLIEHQILSTKKAAASLGRMLELGAPLSKAACDERLRRWNS